MKNRSWLIGLWARTHLDLLCIMLARDCNTLFDRSLGVIKVAVGTRSRCLRRHPFELLIFSEASLAVVFTVWMKYSFVCRFPLEEHCSCMGLGSSLRVQLMSEESYQ